MGGDFCTLFIQSDQGAFQSTPPHGGRQPVAGLDDWAGWFQSTPPHGGRLGLGYILIRDIAVSIHAPAWGATRWLLAQ